MAVGFSSLMVKGKIEKLLAEAWAEFGRVYYDNNADVIRMFEEIFSNLNEKAREKLKELI